MSEPAKPAPAAPYAHPSWATGPNPVDNPHACVLCGLRLRKNHESYRGHFPMEMVAHIRETKSTFHPKQDICKACGEKHYHAVEKTMKKLPWMKGRLG